MSWEKWLLLAAFFVMALLNITMIGKPREPTTHVAAVLAVILFACMATLVVYA